MTRFYVLFNNITVISGRWTDDNEMLCAMEPCLQLKSSPPQEGLEPGIRTQALSLLSYRGASAQSK